MSLNLSATAEPIHWPMHVGLSAVVSAFQNVAPAAPDLGLKAL